MHFPKWLEKKYLDPKNVEAKAIQLRQEGKTIVTLNGSFDLLHVGHLFFLFEAKKQADVLIVALNSDESIRSYKSEERPICVLAHRLEMVAAMECVDYVTYFEETDPRDLLKKVRPDVHVNGHEYGAECIEAKTVQEIGGRLHLLPRKGTLSTSEVIQKIRGLSCV